MKVIPCTFDRHSAAILAILNDAITNTTALYDYKPRSPESMITWFAARQAGNFPVLGLEDESGALLAFATYGVFRNWPAYKYSVEHSIYVDGGHRGRGLGRQLLTSLRVIAQEQNYHVMIGGIDVDNKASIRLHQAVGFVHAGTIKQAGFKFGRWLDLAFFQLILDSPDLPIDG